MTTTTHTTSTTMKKKMKMNEGMTHYDCNPSPRQSSSAFSDTDNYVTHVSHDNGPNGSTVTTEHAICSTHAETHHSSNSRINHTTDRENENVINTSDAVPQSCSSNNNACINSNKNREYVAVELLPPVAETSSLHVPSCSSSSFASSTPPPSSSSSNPQTKTSRTLAVFPGVHYDAMNMGMFRDSGRAILRHFQHRHRQLYGRKSMSDHNNTTSTTITSTTTNTTTHSPLPERPETLRILDVGCGSGVWGLMLAEQYLIDINMYQLHVSPESERKSTADNLQQSSHALSRVAPSAQTHPLPSATTIGSPLVHVTFTDIDPVCVDNALFNASEWWANGSPLSRLASFSGVVSDVLRYFVDQQWVEHTDRRSNTDTHITNTHSGSASAKRVPTDIHLDHRDAFDIILFNPPQTGGDATFQAGRPDRYGGVDGTLYYRRLAADVKAMYYGRGPPVNATNPDYDCRRDCFDVYHCHRKWTNDDVATTPSTVNGLCKEATSLSPPIALPPLIVVAMTDLTRGNDDINENHHDSSNNKLSDHTLPYLQCDCEESEKCHTDFRVSKYDAGAVDALQHNHLLAHIFACPPPSAQLMACLSDATSGVPNENGPRATSTLINWPAATMHPTCTHHRETVSRPLKYSSHTNDDHVRAFSSSSRSDETAAVFKVYSRRRVATRGALNAVSPGLFEYQCAMRAAWISKPQFHVGSRKTGTRREEPHTKTMFAAKSKLQHHKILRKGDCLRRPQMKATACSEIPENGKGDEMCEEHSVVATIEGAEVDALTEMLPNSGIELAQSGDQLQHIEYNQSIFIVNMR